MAEYLPPDARLDSAGLTLLDRFFRTLDHPRFRTMPPGKQILYLQLLRQSHGRQRPMLEASRTDMSAWSGLSWETIKKYVPALIDDGLLAVLREPTNVHPTAYEVRWLPVETDPDARTAPSVVASYIDSLDEEDRKELARLEPLLTLQERRRLQSELGWELRQMGVQVTGALVKALVQWRLLTSSPYRRTLIRKHPDWFAPPS
jgi:hypothetical protein